jgi:transcriptional/translational regulatory protein YebC/TACO1
VTQNVCAEGYGPGGTALLVLGSVPDAALRERIRGVLQDHGGWLGAENAVAYLFRRVGVLRYPDGGPLTARALAAGAEEVSPTAQGDLEVLTDPADLEPVRRALARHGHVPRATGVTWRAQQQLALHPAQMARLEALIEALSRTERVSGVCSNARRLDSPGAHGYP